MPTVNTNYPPHHYVQVGDIHHPDAVKTRIVHVSDTHLKHLDMLADHMIPDGDILVHTGDFNTVHRNQIKDPEKDFNNLVAELNNFFGRLPHKHKIFVPGNHDTNLEDKSWKMVQNHLPTCIYLQDKSVVIDGLKFYGSGWTLVRECSSARAFAVEPEEIVKHWDEIPGDIDILLTHSPPHAILDCAHCRKQGCIEDCEPTAECGHGHIGCPSLKDTVLNILRPRAHLFGHNHGGNGTVMHNGVLFSNASMSYIPVPTVIDYYRTPGDSDVRYSDASHSDISYSDIPYSDASHSGICYSDISYSDASDSDISYSDISYSDASDSGISYGDTSDSDTEMAEEHLTYS